MSAFKKYFFIIILFCAISILSPEEARSWWQPRRSTAATRRHARESIRNKRYNYIREHDLNGDDKVDTRDQLIWLRNKNGSYGLVYVSTENEDLIEIMDLDGDGDVEEWEMTQFYNDYDLDKDGVLEDEEIEAAID